MFIYHQMSDLVGLNGVTQRVKLSDRKTHPSSDDQPHYIYATAMSGARQRRAVRACVNESDAWGVKSLCKQSFGRKLPFL